MLNVSIILATLAFLRNVTGEPFLKLTSDGPVVLDATITFKAQLFGAQEYEPPYYFTFSDDASPGHWNEFTSDSTNVVWNVTYGSKWNYEEREYRMNGRVYVDTFFGRDKIAENHVKYKVTRNLNGVLIYNQNGTVADKTIKSTNLTEFKVNFHDPSNFLKNASMTYYWFINETNFGPSNDNLFNYTFKVPNYYTIEAIVLAQISGEPLNLLKSDTNLTSLKPKELQHQAPPHVKTGMFHLTVESRVPMTHMNFSGNTWVESGRLLDIDISCDGSGPWTACWTTTVPTPYNVTGNETCDDHEGKMELGKNCSFPVLWYFREPGYHNLLVVIDNEISKEVRVFTINMYNSTHVPPITIVAMPISCSLLGIFFVVLGSILLYNFKRNVAIETADFDFNTTEKQLEYKTFWERLRDSMMNAFGSQNNDDISHVSSISSRSVQHPTTSGIHYGSIS